MRKILNVFLVLFVLTTLSIASLLMMNEEQGLSYMREEEKLAHDIYTELYDKWELNTFKNIALSEARHTASVLKLLNDYGYDDPVGTNEIGVFVNSDLQMLYDSLLEIGSQSKIDAIRVGLLVEEVDIKDLEELLAGNLDSRTRRVYENLLRGSENHLRSFYNQLIRLGGEYSPTYLDLDRALSIVSGR
jgi:hypothetical protein